MTTQILSSTQQPIHWWNATDEMIEKWLKDRQALLVLYYQLLNALNQPKKELNLSPLPLTDFCEALIDYVSYGHFRVFEKLVEVEDRAQQESFNALRQEKTSDREPGKTALDKSLIANIVKTTLCALDFNDKYTDQELKNASDFLEDLSFLGEHLAHRLDWEDVLVQQYLSTTETFRAPTKLSLTSIP